LSQKELCERERGESSIDPEGRYPLLGESKCSLIQNMEVPFLRSPFFQKEKLELGGERV